jgi:uncharacterized membrane protein YbhN (UPF0104 family)
MWKTIQEWMMQLLSADLRLVLIGLCVYWLGAVAVAMRWRSLLCGLSCSVSLREVMLANLAFTFVNNVTPGRVGGEILRVAILRRRTQVDWQRAAAASVYDRLVDLTGVPLIVLLALPALPLLVGRARLLLSKLPLARLTPLLVGIGLLGLVVWLLIQRAPQLRDRLRRLVNSLEPWVMPRRSLLQSMGWAWTVWLLDATRLLIAALAFRCVLGPSQAAALSLAYNIGAAVPIMGGLGAIEGSLTATLCLFGITVKTAVAITILERTISYVQGTLAGGVALLAMGGRSLLRTVKSPPSSDEKAG